MKTKKEKLVIDYLKEGINISPKHIKVRREKSISVLDDRDVFISEVKGGVEAYINYYTDDSFVEDFITKKNKKLRKSVKKYVTSKSITSYFIDTDEVSEKEFNNCLENEEHFTLKTVKNFDEQAKENKKRYLQSIALKTLGKVMMVGAIYVLVPICKKETVTIEELTNNILKTGIPVIALLTAPHLINKGNSIKKELKQKGVSYKIFK